MHTCALGFDRLPHFWSLCFSANWLVHHSSSFWIAIFSSSGTQVWGMTEKTAIELKNVDVIYRTYTDSPPGIKKRFSTRDFNRKAIEIHAIKDVSFKIELGQSVGIIGSNGAGKSTLLMAMTGLLPVQNGSIRVLNRPVLLSVNSALRGNLSGRRNIMIGGLAMGMTKEQVKEKLQDIIDFADIGESIDFPMSTYSSGMRARIAFAIVTSIFPEILLIDEALAVGDENFRMRSSERIQAIRDAAGAVILVSHNMSEIVNSCDRAIWLEKGELLDFGESEKVVQKYLEFSDNR
ncbi:MAG: teichoic acid ABC transporter ATP-binding protein [Verrucomicrobiaceae bacterium]|nr:teichoic acid ABC transporter ATP-binding protein [Verrucomicrobiaceae bacterium]